MPLFPEPPSIGPSGPTVLSFSPADEATGVALGANIVVTFSKSIAKGVGSIVLKTSTGATIATYDAATSTNLSISGSTLILNPSADLGYNTGYVLEFAAGTVKDLAGNSYLGTTSYNFNTVSGQIFTGIAVNDTFTSGPGNDTMDGSGGIDTVMYTGSRSSFSLTKTSNGFTLADNTGALGTDTLQNVERIKFTNGGIALDVGATQAAGQTQLMLGAVLGKTLLEHPNNQPLIGTVIDLFDQGYTLNQLSGALMRLPIWDVFTGQANPTNTAIANYLLTRVNGVAPDATTLANAAAALDAQTDYAHGLGDFLGQLALTPANQTQVGLVGLATTGMAFGW